MPGSSLFLGRQPIIGRHGELFAYELLFRSSTANVATIINDVAASAAVVQYAFSDLDMQKVLESKRGFINIPQAMLMNELLEAVPADHVVFEILETVEVTPEVLERCRQLRDAGYVLALDDVVELTPTQDALLPFVKYVKIDILATPRDRLPALVAALLPRGVSLIAEKVETYDDFVACKAMGFSFFQGYYFAKPIIISGCSVQPSVLLLLTVFGKLMADAEIDELDNAIKQSPALALRLLKMSNAVAFGVQQKIATLRQAIFMVGRAQLGRLLQIMIFSQQSGVPPGSDPVLQTAVVRGRMMEGLAIATGQPALKDRAFMAGMLSMIDVLLNQPLEDIIIPLNLNEELVAALISREGLLGVLLLLVEAGERADIDLAHKLAKNLGLSDFDQYNHLHVEALKWAGQL